MAVDIMGVRLHLRLIRVLTVLVDTPSRFEVEVAYRLGRGRVVCSVVSRPERGMTGGGARSGICR